MGRYYNHGIMLVHCYLNFSVSTGMEISLFQYSMNGCSVERERERERDISENNATKLPANRADLEYFISKMNEEIIFTGDRAYYFKCLEVKSTRNPIKKMTKASMR